MSVSPSFRKSTGKRWADELLWKEDGWEVFYKVCNNLVEIKKKEPWGGVGGTGDGSRWRPITSSPQHTHLPHGMSL